MPHEVPLRSGDPRRVARYQLTGRLDGIPSDDPIFIGAGPDGTEVAITVLSGEWALDAAARDRFAAEAAVAKRVPPFCAARVLDAGLDGSQAYLVSEYVRGQSLLELVAAEGVQRGHDLEAVAVGMATGLASVHQAGLVHGSFGPEFVIMAADGSPRVVEFGITPPYGAATPSADMLAWAQTVVFAAWPATPRLRSTILTSSPTTCAAPWSAAWIPSRPDAPPPVPSCRACWVARTCRLAYSPKDPGAPSGPPTAATTTCRDRRRHGQRRHGRCPLAGAGHAPRPSLPSTQAERQLSGEPGPPPPARPAGPPGAAGRARGWLVSRLPPSWPCSSSA